MVVPRIRVVRVFEADGIGVALWRDGGVSVESRGVGDDDCRPDRQGLLGSVGDEHVALCVAEQPTDRIRGYGLMVEVGRQAFAVNGDGL